MSINPLIDGSAFSNLKNLKSIRLGQVVAVDKVKPSVDSKRQRNSDDRFNADPFIIRARILGAEYDRDEGKETIPNAFPLLPKFISAPPKVNEMVLLFSFSDDLKNSDRFYIGPLISSPLNLNKDNLDSATAGLSIGFRETVEDVSKITEAEGIYPDNKDVSIQGRNNADICFKDNEIRLRAGKFVVSQGVPQPTVYNQENPAYIQIKYDVPIERTQDNGTAKRGSVTNIVSSKINLLGVESPISSNFAPKEGTSGFVNLADRTDLITEEGLISIIENAEPLMFGNPMMEYLDLLEKALDNHVHNNLGGGKWTNRDGSTTITDFLTLAKQKREKILSKNIRIN
jgi:hypothetical protein